MADDKQPGVLSILGIAFRFVFTALRTTVYLIIVFLFVAVVSATFRSPPTVPDEAVLVVNPSQIVEENPEFGEIEALASAFGVDLDTPTRARDLVRLLEAAKDDDRIKAVHLDLSNLSQIAYVHIDEIGAALAALRDAGKPVIGSSLFMTQTRYALLSYADEIYLNYFDGVDMLGPVAGASYFAEGLDKLKVERFVYQSGPYKSAGESFVRNEMSEAEREQVSRLLEARWQRDQQRVLANREIDEKMFLEYVESYPELIADAEGDAARLAIYYGLVEDTGDHAQVNARIEEISGIAAGKHSINFKRYLASLGPELSSQSERQIAVVYGMGPIMDGQPQYGVIGGESLAKVIREVAASDNVRAIVLRVDSPGGSPAASETIRRALAAAQEAGKPVIVSMARVAASGGYWVSATADEIWAHPQTITGSIGAIGMQTSLNEAFASIGIHSDYVTTTQVAEDLVGDGGISDLTRRMWGLYIDALYEDFLELAAEGREKSAEEVHEIAQGRVWIGTDAKRLGLVDGLGGLDDAIASAARLAELEDFSVTYHQQEQSISLSLSAVSAILESGYPVLAKLLNSLSELLSVSAPQKEPQQAWRQAEVYCAVCDIAAAAR
ncbi:MAG: signal peptide peptidase SppA [Gammaproteobacteria bacterium]|nr:signal peptide peptidase SppA [Gammaproteobacteria bacterium]MCY4322574.1 signal peptide peptidase SppA [Gammaproteobacteria bacterium]